MTAIIAYIEGKQKLETNRLKALLKRIFIISICKIYKNVYISKEYLHICNNSKYDAKLKKLFLFKKSMIYFQLIGLLMPILVINTDFFQFFEEPFYE